jgi:hypothetical protein
LASKSALVLQLHVVTQAAQIIVHLTTLSLFDDCCVFAAVSSSNHKTNSIISFLSNRFDGWLLCCFPPRSATGHQSIPIEQVDVCPPPPLSPPQLCSDAALSTPRVRKEVVCYVIEVCCAAAIASASMHIICAQVGRVAPTCAEPSGHFSGSDG